MLIDFNEIKEITAPGMNNGTGTMTAKMYMEEQGKIIPCSIHVGGSIGLHMVLGYNYGHEMLNNLY